jgi:DNA-binding PadR family transcriptional regulator
MSVRHATPATPPRPRQPSLLFPHAESRHYQPIVSDAVGSDDEALVLQQLHYRLLQPRHVEDGRAWYKASYADWQQREFPRWSVATLQRTLTALEIKGLVESRRLASHAYERTKYYTINYEALWRLVLARTVDGCTSSQNAMMDLGFLGPCIAANCDDVLEDLEEREEKEPAADVAAAEAENPAPPVPPRRHLSPVTPIATKAVQHTIECPMEDLKTALATRANDEHDLDTLAALKTAEPARYQQLEQAAWEVCLDRARGKRDYVFPLDLKFAMLALLAEESQQPGREGPYGATHEG